MKPNLSFRPGDSANLWECLGTAKAYIWMRDGKTIRLLADELPPLRPKSSLIRKAQTLVARMVKLTKI